MIESIKFANKNWGRTALVGTFNNVLVYHAILINGESSIHMHEHDYNDIYSVDAKLKILLYDDPNDNPVDIIILNKSEMISISPKQIHKFVVIEPGSIFEFYYSNKHDFDIVRFNEQL